MSCALGLGKEVGVYTAACAPKPSNKNRKNSLIRFIHQKHDKNRAEMCGPVKMSLQCRDNLDLNETTLR